mmetsp:Transcript_71011/g.179169  ORF Transcript_71011/g.179169 Transcript_71011/m.179169 type:complete len:201 (-) Transcript_71011:3990-4592(-)
MKVLHQSGCSKLVGSPLRHPRLLLQLQTQLPWALGEASEDGGELETILEEPKSAENVKSQSCPAHSDDKPPNVSQVAHVLCSHKGNDDVVVLLALEPVDCGDFAGIAEERVPRAALADDVADQGFLPIVRREDGNLLSRDAEQSHVHEERHAVLSLAQVLVEVGRWLCLALAIKVVHVYELILVGESSVCLTIFLVGQDV